MCTNKLINLVDALSTCSYFCVSTKIALPHFHICNLSSTLARAALFEAMTKTYNKCIGADKQCTATIYVVSLLSTCTQIKTEANLHIVDNKVFHIHFHLVPFACLCDILT